MCQTVICNGCGKEIHTDIQDFLKIQKEWGYFSSKDLELHEFCLCEECYDRILSDLKIPASIIEKTEVL